MVICVTCHMEQISSGMVTHRRERRGEDDKKQDGQTFLDRELRLDENSQGRKAVESIEGGLGLN